MKKIIIIILAILVILTVVVLIAIFSKEKTFVEPTVVEWKFLFKPATYS